MQLLFVLGNWRISGANSQTDEQHLEPVPRLNTLRMLDRAGKLFRVTCKKSTTKLITAHVWPGSLNASCVLGCSSAPLAQQQDPSAEAALTETKSHCRPSFSSSASAQYDTLGCWQLELLGEALQELCSPNSCSKYYKHQIQTRLLRDLQSQSWKPPRMEIIKSLGQLIPMLDFPYDASFFLAWLTTPLTSIYTCCLLFSHHMALSRTCLHLLNSLHVGIGKLLFSHPKDVLSAVCRLSQLLQLLLTGQVFWALTRPSWLPSSRPAPFHGHPSCIGGLKTRCSFLDGIYQVLSKGLQ